MSVAAVMSSEAVVAQYFEVLGTFSMRPRNGIEICRRSVEAAVAQYDTYSLIVAIENYILFFFRQQACHCISVHNLEHWKPLGLKRSHFGWCLDGDGAKPLLAGIREEPKE